MHEARLHVGAEQHAEPDQVDAELLRSRCQQRDHDERDLEEVEEERQHEHEDVHDREEADLAARQVREQAFDPFLAARALEHEAKGSRAEQDEHDERGDAHRRRHAFPE